MAERIVKNIYLVNAPAGSGKTTSIRKMVRENLEKNPNDNILCITYTNRAANELKKEIDSKQVWVGTIHSFLNEMVSPFLERPEIIELYFSVFKNEIENRCKSQDEKVCASNEKYKEKQGITGDLSLDEIKRCFKKVSYGESQYTSYFYGKLSHDDLIRFSYKMLEKYPAIRQKIAKRFRFIFLDEYQDTDTMVLRMFCDAIKDSPNAKLYILGDKMQQIYSNYDGEFENEFASFDRSMRLECNYRSTGKIVAILNNLYNDTQFSQVIPEENKEWDYLHEPEIIITDHLAEEIVKKREQMPDLLILYLSNASRFKEIGAENLYAAFSKMDKYAYGRKYSAAKVLQPLEEECPDDFLKMVLLVDEILRLYAEQRYGLLLRTIKKNAQIFNRGTYYIEQHRDKKTVCGNLEALWQEYQKDITIGDFVGYLEEHKMIQKDYMEDIQADSDYISLWNVKLEEVRNLMEYLADPHVSTQHGVKGESYESVLFVAEDSSSATVNVQMYRFFELWSKSEVSLPEFEAFYYRYRRDVLSFESIVDTSKISRTDYEKYQASIDDKVDEILQNYAGNPFFQVLCKGEYENCRQKRNVTSVRNCFKKNLNLVYGTLQAYRIFYVGCSRAKRNLTILVEKAKVKEFEELFIKKAAQSGFRIEVH